MESFDAVRVAGALEAAAEGQSAAAEILEVARTRWPLSCARVCAHYMLDSKSSKPSTRQLAALLLKNSIPETTSRKLPGEWLDCNDEFRDQIHKACWVALLDTNSDLARAAAVAAARIASVELPKGNWPEFMPELQRMANAGQSQRIAVLHIMRFLAEDLWHCGVSMPETQLVLLQSSISALLGDDLVLCLAAAEAVFALLGCVHDSLMSEELLRSQLVEALLVAHLAADERLHNDVGAKDVCACILRCWGRLATESPDILAEHMAKLSQILLQTVNSRHSHLAMLSVEFWTSLALQDLEASSGEAYVGDGLVEPVQLTLVLLNVLQGHCEGHMEEAVKVCLGVLVQLEDGDDCIKMMMSFINQHLACLSQPEVKLTSQSMTCSALSALEALMEAPDVEAKITSFLQSQMGSILLAMDRPDLHRHAVSASTRALQCCKDALPEACKDALLRMSLQALALHSHEATVPETAALLRELLASSSASPQQFEALTQQLLLVAEQLSTQSLARTEVLRALGMLIDGAAAECLPSFRWLLMKFLKDLDLDASHADGFGFCLKALTLRLGTSISDIAGELMHFYVSRLDEMFMAAGALVITLGGKVQMVEDFWNALVLSLQPSPRPEACKIALQILLDLNDKLDPDVLHGLALRVMPTLLVLASDPGLCLELCPLALRCMGVQAAAMGVLVPMLQDILETWIRLGRAARKAALRRSTCIQRLQDVELLQLEVFTAVLNCFALFFDGVGGGSLVAIEQQLPDILTFLAECICSRRPMKKAMMSWLKVFAVVLPSYPSSFRLVSTVKPNAHVIKRLAQLSAASPEPGIQDLEQKILHWCG